MNSELKKKFINCEKIKGAMIFEFFSPGIPMILKNSSCQFVIYDMEHGGLSLNEFKTLSVISRNCGISPLIRIPENNYNFIARSLDLGSHGVMTPMVNDEKQTKMILEFSKYPPLGKRGAGFGFAHNDYNDEDDPLEIINFANDNIINIIQIETKKGLENVEKIAKIKGVDCLWVGHFDLTNFLGIPGQFASKPFLDAIDKIVSVAKENNKSLGIMVKEKKEMNFYEDLGFNVIAVGTEISLLTNAIKRIIC